MTHPNNVAIIGAGPAGLTAGYLLSKQNVPVTILEADPTYVGGIARTAKYKGYHFDIGGHRFFSKSKEVEDLWTELLPDDMLDRPRSSRIFYRDAFFSYPLKAGEALRKLGVFESTRCVLSYFKSLGGNMEMGMKVVACHYDAESQLWTTTYEDAQKNRHSIESKHVISSAPMKQLVNGITPKMPEHVIKAANSLKYRDFLTVVL